MVAARDPTNAEFNTTASSGVSCRKFNAFEHTARFSFGPDTSRFEQPIAKDAPSTNANVQVTVRLRPPDPDDDVQETFDFSDGVNGPMLSIKDPINQESRKEPFSYHKIFKPEDTQEPIFKNIGKPLVDKLLQGYNSCIFAYGQTGSGKTHSIFGEGCNENRGLLPRSIEYLFEEIKKKSQDYEIGMVVSFLEIYLDQIRDLGKPYVERLEKLQRNPDGFDSDPDTPKSTKRSSRQENGPIRTGPGGRFIRPSSAQSKNSSRRRPSSAHSNRSGDKDTGWVEEGLEIRETSNGHVYVQNLNMIPVNNIKEVLEIINHGLVYRETHETTMNKISSRSHTVFTINVIQKEKNPICKDKPAITGQFNVVDLAGSERIAKSKSEGKRFQEAVVINASLSALGRVVLSLASSPQVVTYIPYRDSKLTRILQSGLGGNSYTTVLCCINPSSEHYEENLNTLNFAARFQTVENKPIKNEVELVPQSVKSKIKELEDEITILRKELISARDRMFLQQMKQKEITTNHERELIEKEYGESPSPVPGSANASYGLVEDLKNAELRSEEQELQLQEQRKELEELQQAAEKEKEHFTEIKENLAKQEEFRKFEIYKLREEGKKRSGKVKALEFEQEHKFKLLELQYEKLIQEAESKGKCDIAGRSKLIKGIPSILKDRKNVMQENWKIFDKKISKIEKKHQTQLEEVESSHNEQMSNIGKRFMYLIEKVEKDINDIIKEIDKQHMEHKSSVKHYEKDLIKLNETLSMMSKIIRDMESGTFPAGFRCDIKEVMVPGGMRIRRMKDNGVDAEQWQMIMATTREARRYARKYAAVRKQFESSQGPPYCHQTAASEADLSTPPDTPRVIENPFDQFDGQRFSMEFCRSAEQENDNLLCNLSEEKLRTLARCLKERSLGNFNKEDEKAKLREEIMHEMSGHSTIEYLRHLENEVSRYKTLAKDEADRVKKIEVALQSSYRARAAEQQKQKK